MTIRIKADERIGRTVSEPYLTIYLERRANLNDGLESVLDRSISNIRLEVGYDGPRATYSMAPRHLDDLIDLLQRTRDRMNDLVVEEPSA